MGTQSFSFTRPTNPQRAESEALELCDGGPGGEKRLRHRAARVRHDTHQQDTVESEDNMKTDKEKLNYLTKTVSLLSVTE
ncbi:hypothetical protein PAMP_000025 [Pampus punctatissimus]